MNTYSRSKRRTRKTNFDTTQSLACRQLLTSIQLTGHTLHIEGSDSDDHVVVESDGDTVVASLEVDGIQLQSTFGAREVKEVRFEGFGGDDHLANRTHLPTFAWGHSGDDTLIGGRGTDQLIGNTGNDVLIGSESNDSLWGVEGDDFIVGGDGDDYLDGDLGKDQIFGDAGNDVFFGGDGIDRLFGDAGADQIEAGNGNDFVNGGDGPDAVFGGGGRDILEGGRGDDSLNGGVGNDKLYGGADNDTLNGANGNDLLSGNAGTDSLKGGKGSDRMFGGNGNDRLSGGDGNDRMEGGSGRNTLDGGKGKNSKSNRAKKKGPASKPFYKGVSESDVNRLSTVAEANWAAVGADPRGLDIEYRIADLPDDAVGYAIGKSDGSSVIFIDNTAADLGWFVDATPRDSSEFEMVEDIGAVTDGNEALYGLDLLTILQHELGHAIGLTGSKDLNIMTEPLMSGVRLMPTTEAAAMATGQSIGPSLQTNWWFNGSIMQSAIRGLQEDVGFQNNEAQILYDFYVQVLIAYLQRWLS